MRPESESRYGYGWLMWLVLTTALLLALYL
jgi:hypothetical protein